MYLCKLGERTYEFQSIQQANKAQELYDQSPCSQNLFEDSMERENIDFQINFDGYFN